MAAVYYIIEIGHKFFGKQRDELNSADDSNNEHADYTIITDRIDMIEKGLEGIKLTPKEKAKLAKRFDDLTAIVHRTDGQGFNTSDTGGGGGGDNSGGTGNSGGDGGGDGGGNGNGGGKDIMSKNHEVISVDEIEYPEIPSNSSNASKMETGKMEKGKMG